MFSFSFVFCHHPQPQHKKAPSAALIKSSRFEEKKRVRSVPFCFRESTWSVRSASRTCSVPWSPAAVTCFPSRHHRSTDPEYSHDTSVSSKVYPMESGRGAPGASMMDGRRFLEEWRWIRQGSVLTVRVSAADLSGATAIRLGGRSSGEASGS